MSAAMAVALAPADEFFCLRVLPGQVVDRHGRPGGGKPLGDGSADPGRRTGDKRRLAGKRFKGLGWHA
jgi:hypothetical protein